MQENLFFDTSVLVYAFDDSEPKKREICRGLLQAVEEGEAKGSVSGQVLCELYNVLTENMHSPMVASQAASIAKAFVASSRWVKLDYTHATVDKALSSAAFSRVEIWDTLIAETMRENGITTIVTENEKDFRRIPGIRVVNPFK